LLKLARANAHARVDKCRYFHNLRYMRSSTYRKECIKQITFIKKRTHFNKTGTAKFIVMNLGGCFKISFCKFHVSEGILRQSHSLCGK